MQPSYTVLAQDDKEKIWKEKKVEWVKSLWAAASWKSFCRVDFRVYIGLNLPLRDIAHSQKKFN